MKITGAIMAGMAVVAGMIVLGMAMPAWAGPLDIARAQDQAFDNAILACKPDAALALFDQDAVAIFPGQGEMERGKSAIARLVNSFADAFCPDEQKKSTLRDASFVATPIGADYILVVRVINASDKNGDHAQFRTTELLHQVGGKWSYLVDHISVGLAPAAGADPAP